MSQKDITEKMLADYNDVFADIVNVLLFKGMQLVDPLNLENIKDKSQYKADDSTIHEEERDVTKVLKDGNIRISLIGLENQTTIDIDEPLRVIGYDGASYRSQLLGGGKDRYPVVTLVLYFGMKRWKGKKSLYDVLNIGDEWKPYVNDYKINLFEIAFLTPEQVNMFQSDFKIVADYFVQKRTNNDYKPSREVIHHVDEVLKLMTVLTKDGRFKNVQGMSEAGGVTMCEVLDKIVKEGEIRGEAKGKIEGKIEAYLDMNLTVKEIAEKVNLTVPEVEEILDSLSNK